ncbi:MAG TPA: endonuclease [Planctomycetaceae bacterium]|nr:endonuclease [Planctomycetaceae bacterium]
MLSTDNKSYIDRGAKMMVRHLALLVFLLVASTKLCAQEADRLKLRVLTYNIHHGQGTDGRLDLERIAQVISDTRPDVVALQEVDRNTNRSGGIDQAAKLGELTGLNHAFGTAMQYSGGQYGEAILTRFEIQEAKTYRLPFRSKQEPRCALAAEINAGGGLPPILIVGTHLCHQSEESRIEQSERINRLFASVKNEVILAGDLNARPGSKPMKVLLDEHWVDAIAPMSRIDYVLFRSSSPWKVAEVQIIDNRIASDHRPVLAVLEWSGG